MLRAEFVGEVASHGEVLDRRHAAIADGLRPRFPHLRALRRRTSWSCSRGTEAARRRGWRSAKAWPIMPPMDRPTQCALSIPQPVEHVARVVGELRERVGRGVTTLAPCRDVHADHAKARRQRRAERSPTSRGRSRSRAPGSTARAARRCPSKWITSSARSAIHVARFAKGGVGGRARRSRPRPAAGPPSGRPARGRHFSAARRAAEFLPAAHGRASLREHQHAARAVVEAGPVPDLVPASA
jgi:hypothetical protein